MFSYSCVQIATLTTVHLRFPPTPDSMTLTTTRNQSKTMRKFYRFPAGFLIYQLYENTEYQT